MVDQAVHVAIKGRPCKSVDRELLGHLRELRFTWEQISSLLGVSSKTLQRRARQWGITTFGSISDEDLDGTVQSILTQFPQSGEVLMCGHLRARKVYY